MESQTSFLFPRFNRIICHYLDKLFFHGWLNLNCDEYSNSVRRGVWGGHYWIFIYVPVEAIYYRKQKNVLHTGHINWRLGLYWLLSYWLYWLIFKTWNLKRYYVDIDMTLPCMYQQTPGKPLRHETYTCLQITQSILFTCNHIFHSSFLFCYHWYWVICNTIPTS